MQIADIKKNKNLKEVVWSFLYHIAPMFFQFLLTVYIARSLGIEIYGIFSFFFSIFSILVLLSGLGINVSTAKYAAQYNKTEKLVSVLHSGIRLRILFSTIFIIIIISMHDSLAILTKRPELSQLFLLSTPLLFLNGISSFLKKVFEGLHRLKYAFIISLLESVLKLLLVVLLFHFVSFEISNIVVAFILVYFISVIIGFSLLYNNYYIKNKTNNTITGFHRDIFNYSLPLFIVSIGVSVATDIDSVMIGLFSNNAEVGYYSISKQIITKLPIISLIISSGIMPVFAKINKNNREKLSKLFYYILKTNAMLYLMIALAVFILSPLFIPLIFGPQYSHSVMIIQILLPFSILSSFSILLSSFLTYQGLADKRAKNFLFSTLIDIVLNFILIPKYGAIGAAVSTSIAYIPYVLLNWMDVRKVLKNKI